MDGVETMWVTKGGERVEVALLMKGRADEWDFQIKDFNSVRTKEMYDDGGVQLRENQVETKFSKLGDKVQEALGLKTKTVEEDQQELMELSTCAGGGQSEGEKSDADSESSDDMLGAICGAGAGKKVPRKNSGLPASSSRGAASSGLPASSSRGAASAPQNSKGLLLKPSPSKPPCPSQL